MADLERFGIATVQPVMRDQLDEQCGGVMAALAGKARAVAIEVADGELGPAFLRQPAQQSIRFLT
ncbi:hypothetical protein D3C80_1542210 [compost metagenome]